MSLFKMWEDAFINKKLPKEWNKWDNFRSWAITNRYKAEYGYKGEFSLEGCLKAMPKTESGVSQSWKETIFDVNGTVENLKKYAAKSNIDLGKARTKKEIIDAIMKVGEDIG